MCITIKIIEKEAIHLRVVAFERVVQELEGKKWWEKRDVILFTF